MVLKGGRFNRGGFNCKGLAWSGCNLIYANEPVVRNTIESANPLSSLKGLGKMRGRPEGQMLATIKWKAERGHDRAFGSGEAAN